MASDDTIVTGYSFKNETATLYSHDDLELNYAKSTDTFILSNSDNFQCSYTSDFVYDISVTVDLKKNSDNDIDVNYTLSDPSYLFPNKPAASEFVNNDRFYCKPGVLVCIGQALDKKCEISFVNQEDEEYDTGDEIEEKQTGLTNARFKGLVGQVMHVLGQSGVNVVYPTTEGKYSGMVFNPTTFPPANIDVCTGNECKNAPSYYIEQSIREVSSYCNTIYTAYGANSKTVELDRVNECIDFNEFYVYLEKNGYVNDLTSGCGFVSSELRDFLDMFLTIVMILAPLIAIVLGILDFVKVVASGDADKELKKAFKNFMTRVGMAALLLIIPIILAFLLDVFMEAQPGYDSEDPFCSVFNFDESTVEKVGDE